MEPSKCDPEFVGLAWQWRIGPGQTAGELTLVVNWPWGFTDPEFEVNGLHRCGGRGGSDRLRLSPRGPGAAGPQSPLKCIERDFHV